MRWPSRDAKQASQIDNPKVDFVAELTVSSMKEKFGTTFVGLSPEDVDKAIAAKQRTYCEVFFVAALCARQHGVCLAALQLFCRRATGVVVGDFAADLVEDLQMALAVSSVPAEGDDIQDVGLVAAVFSHDAHACARFENFKQKEPSPPGFLASRSLVLVFLFFGSELEAWT